jgi:hypothetical protein
MILRLLLLVAQISSALLITEISFRAYWSYVAPRRMSAILASQMRTDDGLSNYVADPYSGYRYAPNRYGQLGTPWFSHWRTNSHGHVSDEEYQVQKPAGEFRIAAVGDSYTAGILSNMRWPDVLQKMLNESPAWRTAVGGKFTRVINFGIDGTGFQQFAGVVAHHVPAYGPDLIIVNFMVDDLLRRWNQRSCANPNASDRANCMVAHYLKTVDWFEPCSLGISVAGWRGAGTCRRIPVDPAAFLVQRTEGENYYPRSQAVSKSAAAIREMMRAPHITFFHHPTPWELEGRPLNQWTELMTATQNEVPDWQVVSMLPLLAKRLEGKRLQDRPDLAALSPAEIAALPDDEKPELYRWTYLPVDVHYTDYGNVVYADAVARTLIERVSSPAAGQQAAGPASLVLK